MTLPLYLYNYFSNSVQVLLEEVAELTRQALMFPHLGAQNKRYSEVHFTSTDPHTRIYACLSMPNRQSSWHLPEASAVGQPWGCSTMGCALLECFLRSYYRCVLHPARVTSGTSLQMLTLRHLLYGVKGEEEEKKKNAPGDWSTATNLP
eukprot:1149294-Pelagomonas_calceolata.AAC.3